jgi:anti-sigma factor RsiW
MNGPYDTVSHELTCRSVAPHWSAYVDDAVPALIKLRMARHVSTCADCRRYLRQITMVRDALKMLTGHQPSRAQQRLLRERFAARHAQ